MAFFVVARCFKPMGITLGVFPVSYATRLEAEGEGIEAAKHFWDANPNPISPPCMTLPELFVVEALDARGATDEVLGSPVPPAPELGELAMRLFEEIYSHIGRGR